MIASLRHAFRSLRRSPAFAVTVIATLGIGIGLNAAIFTVVDCVLLRPLGYHDADRIVSIQTHFVDENRSIARIGGDDFVDLAQEVKGFEAVAYYQGGGSDGISLDGAALFLPLALASPGFTKVMGVQAIAGGSFGLRIRTLRTCSLGQVSRANTSEVPTPQSVRRSPTKEQ